MEWLTREIRRGWQSEVMGQVRVCLDSAAQAPALVIEADRAGWRKLRYFGLEPLSEMVTAVTFTGRRVRPIGETMVVLEDGLYTAAFVYRAESTSPDLGPGQIRANLYLNGEQHPIYGRDAWELVHGTRLDFTLWDEEDRAPWVRVGPDVVKVATVNDVTWIHSVGSPRATGNPSGRSGPKGYQPVAAADLSVASMTEDGVCDVPEVQSDCVVSDEIGAFGKSGTRVPT